MNWNAIADILVSTCGWTVDDYGRQQFIQAMEGGCTEYQFMGGLGFGGKLYRNRDGLHVDCPLEDRRPERSAMMAATNEKLKAMKTKETR